MDLVTDGYLVIPGYLSRAEIVTAKAIVEHLHGAGKQYAHADGTVIANLQAKHPWIVGLLEKPALEGVLRPALNDAYYRTIPQGEPNYILGEYIARSGNEKPLPLHIDAWMPSRGEDTWMCQVAIALEDRGPHEGCTFVVPGSHRSGKFADRETTDLVTVPATAGDCIVWDSRLWHGAFARSSESMGWALIATFQRWWVKQRFDIPALTPRNGLSEKRKALLGFYSTPPTVEEEGAQKRGWV